MGVESLDPAMPEAMAPQAGFLNFRTTGSWDWVIPCCRGFPGIFGCLATSLVSSHWIPVLCHPPRPITMTKVSPGVARYLRVGGLPLLRTTVSKCPSANIFPCVHPNKYITFKNGFKTCPRDTQNCLVSWTHLLGVDALTWDPKNRGESDGKCWNVSSRGPHEVHGQTGLNDWFIK